MPGKFFEQPSSEQSNRVPPGQHLAKGFPILSCESTPRITKDKWLFKVFGLVREKRFSWSDFMALPQQSFTADFHCVTRWSKLDVKWRGIKVLDFIKLIEIDPKATHILQHCYGGYTTNLTLEDFLREENFFAHTLYDEPLPEDRGGPMRLVIPHLYAWKSAKWINAIEFCDSEKLGFWEKNGYHPRGEPWQQERYAGRG